MEHEHGFVIFFWLMEIQKPDKTSKGHGKRWHISLHSPVKKFSRMPFIWLFISDIKTTAPLNEVNFFHLTLKSKMSINFTTIHNKKDFINSVILKNMNVFKDYKWMRLYEVDPNF